MATITFDDSASAVSDKPPSYDAIYTSISTDSIRCKRSVFSFLQSKKKRRCAPVLSRIHEIVSSPVFALSSVAPIVESCAAALPAAEFSNLLQKPNIEGHTALYWAIVNNRWEVLLEFIKFISKFSPACASDLRLACMTVNDHDLFMLLNLGDNVNAKDISSRHMLNCPRDEIQVIEGDGTGQNYFCVHFLFRMLQKRLRITQKVEVEFVARGRIWVLRFYVGSDGMWCIEYGLAEHSSPVHASADLVIQAYSRQSDSSCATPNALMFRMRSPSNTLVPEVSFFSSYHDVEPTKKIVAVLHKLDDWLMDDNSVYVDCNGTLRLELTMTME